VLKNVKDLSGKIQFTEKDFNQRLIYNFKFKYQALVTRYFVKISFKGTNYQGWQIQPRAITVQGTLTKAINLILAEDIGLTGAGRTDTGVHAMNYYAHFDSIKEDLHLNDSLKRKLNSFLPFDIMVQNVEKVNGNAHARYDAISRTYHYIITNNKNPFLKDFSYHFYGDIDIDNMNEACKIIRKHVDFTSFSKLHGNNKTNLCKIMDAEWRWTSGGILIFRITANRFLRGMVRAIVGTMLTVGKGKISGEHIETIFSEMNRGAAGMSAPANGLFLTNIRYPDNILPAENESEFTPVLPVSDLFF
jgi:tRNA pseudouridine38-40 synthase